MAKARRAKVRTTKSKSRSGRSKVKEKSRKARRKSKRRGVVGKLVHAVEVVGEGIQEGSKLRRKMGSRGGLSDG
jgi:hypothetical protein